MRSSKDVVDEVNDLLSLVLAKTVSPESHCNHVSYSR